MSDLCSSELLYGVRSDEVGIIRSANVLERAQKTREEMQAELDETGIPKQSKAFNLTWHDWMNHGSQNLVSRAIAAAALAREDSRGAHFREDFPETRDLEDSRYTLVRLKDGEIVFGTEPVAFTREIGRAHV